MGRLVLVACAAFAFAVGAKADEATDLVYFSGDLVSGRNYAGLGWMHSVSGLDATGLIFSAEAGAPQWRSVFAAAQAGWRYAGPGFAITFMGGAEADPRLHPLASADLWFEPTANLMTQVRYVAATDWTSWRVATGWRPSADWPWLGPEAEAAAGWPRLGLHATGLELPDDIEARVSIGASWRKDLGVGPYGEVCAWKRF